VFFSEEKNQKTFDSAPADRSRPWPDRLHLLKNKSLLLLFFRKEVLPYPAAISAAASHPDPQGDSAA
jgi:hypothetical protein